MIYSKEELEWIAKKVRRNDSFKSKSSWSYIHHKKNHNNRNNSTNILVKITSKSKSFLHSKAHLNYISRENNINIIDDELNQYTEEEAQKIIKKYIMLDDTARSDSSKTYNMVFSMKGKNDSQKMIESSIEAIKSEYPNNKIFCTCHEDTENTHVHLIMIRKTKDLKHRKEIRKQNLNGIKFNFAEALNKRGIEAKFLSESDKQNLNKDRKERITNTYQVIDFGVENYKFDRNNPRSYFIKVATHNGIMKTHWSKKLRTEIEEKGVRKGAIIGLKKTNNNWEIQDKNEKKYLFEKRESTLIDFGIENYKFDKHSKKSGFVILNDEILGKQIIWNKKVLKQVKELGLKRDEKVVFNPSIGMIQKSEGRKLMKKREVKL